MSSARGTHESNEIFCGFLYRCILRIVGKEFLNLMFLIILLILIMQIFAREQNRLRIIIEASSM